MGRPIDSMYFGDPAAGGSQLTVKFGATPTNGYIIKQIGSRRYRCTDDGTTTVEDCTLSVDAPVAGTCNILVGGALVSKLTAHRATLTDGTSVPWTDADLADAVVLATTAKSEPKPEPKEEVKKSPKKSYFKKSKKED